MAEQSQQKQVEAKPRLQMWNVLVRHSTFLLKNWNVEAASAEEAKRLFIEKCKERHEERARSVARDKRLDTKTIQTTQDRISDAFRLGVQEQDKLEWCIRLKSEVDAERELLKEEIARSESVFRGV